MAKRIVSLTVNGRRREEAVGDSTLLLDFLREQLALTGTKRGCDGGECGACTVLIDGEPALACITLATRCNGRHVETIESLAVSGRMSALQAAFHESLGTQCGFCTPGMIMAAIDIVKRHGSSLDEATVRQELEGNICRCTGYHNIVRAIETGAAAMTVAKQPAE